MTEIEHVKRKAEDLSLQSPKVKLFKSEDSPTVTRTFPAGYGGPGNVTPTTASSIESPRGNVTIIHLQMNGKQAGSRMQWTFPRSYLTGRTRAKSPQSPGLLIANNSMDTELNTANIAARASFTHEAIEVFYRAITRESSVPSTGHKLHEYCQVFALAQYFGVQNIFQDGEAVLLKRVMNEETSLEDIRVAAGLASIFKWRALVERCRSLLAKRVRALEMDLRGMNCGGLSVLATKLDEVYEFLAKSGSVTPNSPDLRKEQKGDAKCV
jgi:hypothetical protein